MALEAVLISAAALGGSGCLAYLGASIAQNVAKFFLFYDEFETEKITPRDLKAGDHIFVPGSVSQGLKTSGLVGYYHHGVYLGLIGGRHTVTDWAYNEGTHPKMRGLDEFLGTHSNELYRRRYKFPGRILPPEETVKFARLICSGKHPWPKYSLNTNNCEHYASLLKMAQVYSKQAQILPQEIFYRQMIAPNLGRSILKQHAEEH